MNPAEFAVMARAEREHWWYRGMERILFDFARPYISRTRFRRLLDAGCGTGYLASVLLQRGWPVYAVDLGREGVTLARAQGLERVAQADVLRLPFPDGSFDAVVSMDVLVHMRPGQEQSAFLELARVLAPGGLLLLRVAAFHWLRSRHSEHVGEHQRFTRGQVLELARRAGLQVQRCSYANSLLLPIALAKFRVWEPITRQAPASGVEPAHPLVNAVLELPLRLEAGLIGAGVNLPLGQSILVAARKP